MQVRHFGCNRQCVGQIWDRLPLHRTLQFSARRILCTKRLLLRQHGTALKNLKPPDGDTPKSTCSPVFFAIQGGFAEPQIFDLFSRSSSTFLNRLTDLSLLTFNRILTSSVTLSLRVSSSQAVTSRYSNMEDFISVCVKYGCEARAYSALKSTARGNSERCQQSWIFRN